MKTKTDQDTELIRELLAALKSCEWLALADVTRLRGTDIPLAMATARSKRVAAAIVKATAALHLRGAS